MRLTVLLGVLLLVGCPGEPPGAGTDSGLPAADAGVTPGADAGLGDAGYSDAGYSDAAFQGLKVCTVPKPAQGPEPAECGPPPAGTCASAADCASGLCLKLATGSRCTSACKIDTDCGTDERCRIVERLGEGYCVPKTGAAP